LEIVQPTTNSQQARRLPVAADDKRLLQHREDVVDVRPDPFRRRGRLALRPQIVDMLDERRAEPQAHALGIGQSRRVRRHW
jgi:hypothetical protein